MTTSSKSLLNTLSQDKHNELYKLLECDGVQTKRQTRLIAVSAYCLESMEECLMAANLYIDSGHSASDWWLADDFQLVDDFAFTSSANDEANQGQDEAMAAKKPDQNLGQVSKDKDHKESLQDVMSVLITAVRAHLDSFQPQHALKYAEKALEFSQKLEHLHQSAGVQQLYTSTAQYWMGVVYSKIAGETFEAEHYLHLNQYARQCFESALMHRVDSRVLYSLALSYFEIGELKLAAKWSQECLQLDPFHINCWHLTLFVEWVLHASFGSEDITQQRLQLVFKQMDKLNSTLKFEDLLTRQQRDEWLNLKMTEAWFRMKQSTNSVKDRVLQVYSPLFSLFRAAYGIKAGAIQQADDEAPHTLSSLNHGLIEYFELDAYPVVNTLYPMSQYQSDTRGFKMQSPFFPGGMQNIAMPLRGSVNKRRCKSRYIELWLNLSQQYRDLGEYQLARQCLDNIVAVERDQADAEVEYGLLTLLDCAVLERQPFMCELIVDGQVSGSQDAKRTLENLDLVRVDQNVVTQALQHFKAALVHDNNHLTARTWLGRIYHSQNRLQLARFELERAIRSGRARGCKDWQAWDFMAKCCGSAEVPLAYDEARQTQCEEAAQTNCALAICDANCCRGIEVLPKR